ncbi:hypothetical protein [Runella sp.]|uniref:hypothetical protein n=1 Tax=Runella sp. TaxID=1960881 RepID=UPI003D11DFAC
MNARCGKVVSDQFGNKIRFFLNPLYHPSQRQYHHNDGPDLIGDADINYKNTTGLFRQLFS